MLSALRIRKAVSIPAQIQNKLYYPSWMTRVVSHERYDNGTIHAWDRNVRDFTVPSERGGIHRAWRDPPSVEGSPEGAVGPEGDPDTRGGSRHARWILTCEVGL